MSPIKRNYVQSMHALAAVPRLRRFTDGATTAGPYGWERWFASLLAIHNVQRMIELDLPWWNVAATHEIAAFLAQRAEARVFEYGAGASTAWLARRSAEVVSVEHDPAWHSRISPLIHQFSNAAVWHRDIVGDDYSGAIEEADGQFDLIVVDGRERTDCLAAALGRLKVGGRILFDDSGRRRYRPAIESCGLRERRYFGRSYCVPYPDFSSVLYG